MEAKVDGQTISMDINQMAAMYGISVDSDEFDIEFRENLPKTLVGKVAYTVLEKEEAAAEQSA